MELPRETRVIRRRVAIGGLFVVLFALGWWAGHSSSRDLYADLDLFVDVLDKVEQNYVDPVKPQKLVQGALQGLTRQLDPFSQYLDEKSFDNLQTVTRGEFGGIGVLVVVRDRYPTVVSPIEGTPAWKAGLKAGDVITHIDGTSAAGLSTEEVAAHLRGAPGTKVALTWTREGESEPLKATLERGQIEVRPVPYSFVLDRGVGYVRLASFSEKTAAEVREAVERLRADGAHSLVLDLRGNPGGLLDQAVGVTEQFVPRGKMVVYTHGRMKNRDQRYYAGDAHPEVEWPMAVLVDQGSASAAEIVAGALQDLDRAVVIGHTSFGKGSVQDVFPLRGERAALKLTTALYYSPSGRSIHRHMTADSLDEDDDDDTTTPTQPSDSLPKPVFHTASGRVVYGGGGITPDITVAPDTLTGLARTVASRNLATRFVTRWAATHPGNVSLPAAWEPFISFLREQKVALSADALTAARPRLEWLLRREMALHTGGLPAAARVALADDAVMSRAIAVLLQAHRPADVFAAAVPPPTRRGAHPAGVH